MNPLAFDTLKRLQRETGRQLDPVEDHERICALVEASEKALHADESPALTALLKPSRRVGNITLHRLSHGAKSFYQEEIWPIWKDSAFSDMAFAWCMAHSREPELLWAYAGAPRKLRRAIRKWERSLRCCTEELFAAIRDMMDEVQYLYGEAQDGEESRSSGLAQWVQALAKETGRSLEDLLWRCPEEELILLAQNLPGPGAQVMDPSSPRIREMRKFHEVAAELRAYLESKEVPHGQ